MCKTKENAAVKRMWEIFEQSKKEVELKKQKVLKEKLEIKKKVEKQHAEILQKEDTTMATCEKWGLLPPKEEVKAEEVEKTEATVDSVTTNEVDEYDECCEEVEKTKVVEDTDDSTQVAADVKKTQKKGWTKLEHSKTDFLVSNFPCAATLYLYLQQQEVTWKKKVDKFNLYEEYYLRRGLICVSISTRELARVFSRQRDAVEKWIKKLESSGALKIKQIKLGKGRNCKVYNIYVLGRLVGNEKCYFI